MTRLSEVYYHHLLIKVIRFPYYLISVSLYIKLYMVIPKNDSQIQRGAIHTVFWVAERVSKQQSGIRVYPQETGSPLTRSQKPAETAAAATGDGGH